MFADAAALCQSINALLWWYHQPIYFLLQPEPDVCRFSQHYETSEEGVGENPRYESGSAGGELGVWMVNREFWSSSLPSLLMHSPAYSRVDVGHSQSAVVTLKLRHSYTHEVGHLAGSSKWSLSPKIKCWCSRELMLCSTPNFCMDAVCHMSSPICFLSFNHHH